MDAMFFIVLGATLASFLLTLLSVSYTHLTLPTTSIV